jgi:flagellar protein FlaI
MSRNDKIVTVEEVPELSPPLPNWTQLNSRQSFQFGEKEASSIRIFDLVKVSLRYRPDYIIVGEIRGEEAFTLFQALATGHGGLCTMHADSLSNVVKRLTSPPMNVSKVYIPLMNSALHIQRVELPKPRNGLKFGRRIRTIWEIEEYEQYREVALWNPRTDTFDTWFENSFLLEKIAVISGKTRADLLGELEIRKKYLQELKKEGIRDQKAVAEKILSFYTEQRETKDSHSRKSKRENREKIESQRRLSKFNEDKKVKFPDELKQPDILEQEIPINPLVEGEM